MSKYSFIKLKQSGKVSVMVYTTNLKDCKVLVKDIENERVIARTVSKSFDPYNKILSIPMSSVNVCESQPVIVWIFSGNSIYEYFGQMKKTVIANEVEIVLSSGKLKEERKAERYQVEMEGSVNGIVIDSQRVTLRKPIAFSTINISENGILFKTMSGSFERGDQIELKLNASLESKDSRYRVVRIHYTALDTETYGCQKLQ